jgi:hypothetical protein
MKGGTYTFECSGNFVQPDPKKPKAYNAALNTSVSSANSSFFED